MNFAKTTISGVISISAVPHHDARGYFARIFCGDEFARAEIDPVTAQMALSHNKTRGTLRGLHVIPFAYGEAKLVRCLQGEIFDVAVDLRPGAPTYGQWQGFRLSAENMDALYIPCGVAHGFVTLSDNVDILYQFSEAHRPGVEIGLTWDDPTIGVTWPIAPIVMSEKDKNLPRLSQIAPLL